MSGLRLTFWTVFTLGGLWLQSFMPGVDFLAPGLILSLQEEKPRTSLIMGLIWLMLQEGTGSLAFGTVVLWYGVLAAVFFLGHWLFEAKNFLFVVILGACLGVLHFGLMNVMTQLQDWRVPAGRVLLESIVQTAVFPVEWGLLYIIYNHLPQNAQDV
ncbi:MAG: hypothetical protein HY795_01330 [Desulfovibrio sp.]|nr:hypothetical protein [Desulfovibrio sp.]MBI4958615.1 hypothetical protein [Desulfovibrio sp.]